MRISTILGALVISILLTGAAFAMNRAEMYERLKPVEAVETVTKTTLKGAELQDFMQQVAKSGFILSDFPYDELFIVARKEKKQVDLLFLNEGEVTAATAISQDDFEKILKGPGQDS